jgi:hypothetical protein
MKARSVFARSQFAEFASLSEFGTEASQRLRGKRRAVVRIPTVEEST